MTYREWLGRQESLLFWSRDDSQAVAQLLAIVRGELRATDPVQQVAKPEDWLGWHSRRQYALERQLQNELPPDPREMFA